MSASECDCFQFAEEPFPAFTKETYSKDLVKTLDSAATMHKTHLSSEALVEMLLPKLPIIWSAGCKLLQSVYNAVKSARRYRNGGR